MTNCVFCKIIAGEIPAAKIYEDDKVLAFLDINPVNFGHTLIIPKEHFQYMTETPDDLMSYLYIKVKMLMPVIKNAVKADYVALAVVGEDVPHFHVHIIPRFHNDSLTGMWPTKKYQEGEMEVFKEKIKNAL